MFHILLQRRHLFCLRLFYIYINFKWYYFVALKKIGMVTSKINASHFVSKQSSIILVTILYFPKFRMILFHQCEKKCESHERNIWSTFSSETHIDLFWSRPSNLYIRFKRYSFIAAKKNLEGRQQNRWFTHCFEERYCASCICISFEWYYFSAVKKIWRGREEK